ncbi:MAG: MarR family transcriptional regulator [Candidatus Woesearchaeota archaeon]|nr:MarR family transcriptional regulator [Candidatus Woesearchaeota archaeon]
MGEIKLNRPALIFASIMLLSALSSAVFAQDKEANVSVQVVRMPDETSIFTLILLFILFVLLLAAVYYLLRYIALQHKKSRALREKVRPKADIEESDYMHEHKEEISDLSMDTEVDKYLKEDEKTVISILRQRGGVMSQSTLRIAGNFSKATLSRILKELEQRNIIKKEQRGKKNLVILK